MTIHVDLAPAVGTCFANSQPVVVVEEEVEEAPTHASGGGGNPLSGLLGMFGKKK